MKVEAIDYSSKTIYHSPETPGYTSWCTLWQSKGDHIQLAFQQITGPADKPELRRNETVILESTDEGAIWNFERAVPARSHIAASQNGIYASPADSSFCGHGLVSIADGTLITGLWGGSQSETGYIQRSKDGGRTWSDPITFMDAGRYKTYPTLIRQLRDGRLVLFAGVWDRQSGEAQPRTLIKTMFVSDDEGKSWGPPVVLMTAEEGVCEESDFCELPNGNLFWVHRAEHYSYAPSEISPLAARMGESNANGHSDRMQSLVRKVGTGWKAEKAVAAPFPHSGFPELLKTQEGLLLHIATDSIWWTAHAGAHWTQLDIPGSSYYPRSMQLADGKILVIGHDGSDDVYGTLDQSIRQQTFRLKITDA